MSQYLAQDANDQASYGYAAVDVSQQDQQQSSGYGYGAVDETPAAGASAGAGAGAGAASAQGYDMKDESTLRDIIELNDTVDYFATRKYYQHVASTCETFIKSHGAHASAHASFWFAFSQSMQGKYSEAIRDFEPLQQVPGIRLAVTAALITTHGMCTQKDKQALSVLKGQLKQATDTTDHSELLFAGRYFWHAGRDKQARKCVERVLAKARDNTNALSTYGWLYFYSNTERLEKKAGSFFSAAAQIMGPTASISALLGCAMTQERSGNVQAAIERLNQIIVSYPDFTGGLVEKSRIQMMIGQWDDALETANRVLKQDFFNIEALKLIVVFKLAQENNLDAIVDRMDQLREALNQTEGANAHLLCETSRLLARLATNRQPLLDVTLEMISKACQLSPLNTDFLTEKGYQHRLMGDFQNAIKCFSEASQVDESNIAALFGRIHCKISAGNLDEAHEELKFLIEIEDSETRNPQLTFLMALLEGARSNNSKEALQLLDETVDLHIKATSKVPPGFEYYLRYNPTFVLELCNAFMPHINAKPRHVSEPESPIIKRVIALLRDLVRIVPGLLEGHLLLTQCYFALNDMDMAKHEVGICTKLGPKCSDAYMWLGRIAWEQGHHKEMDHALAQTLSLNFDVRGTPIYHVMKARLLSVTGRVQDALELAKAGMEMPGIRKRSTLHPWSVQERITLFLETCQLYAQQNLISEASRLLLDAKQEFANSPDANRIPLVEADIAVGRQDFDGAIDLLQSIRESNPVHRQARMKLAEIYLKHRHDRRKYIACYEQMAREVNTAHQFVLLGEAYMRIQEPDKAIQAYQAAQKLEPNDIGLTSRIGRALVITHDYGRAVDYYESAIEEEKLDATTRASLSIELAELYVNLREFDAASRTVIESLSEVAKQLHCDFEEVNFEEVNETLSELFKGLPASMLMHDVKGFLLMKSIAQGSKNDPNTRLALECAHSVQSQLLTALRHGHDEETLRIQRKEMAQICVELATFFERRARDNRRAEEFYNAALNHDDADEAALLASARLHMQNRQFSQCQQRCAKLLSLNENHCEAGLLLSELMFHQDDYNAAMYSFRNLLEKHPTRYNALAKYIQLLRRAGRLKDAPRCFELAESVSDRAKFEAGFHYCRGLYHLYTGESRDALREFNFARKDGRWGREALTSMIRIYINPDIALFKQATEAKGNSKAEHIASARELLEELKRIESESSKLAVLEGYINLASSNNNKSRVEQVMNSMLVIMKTDRTYVPAMLLYANAALLIKQTVQARNTLKRIEKMEYNIEFAEEYERGWLTLADLYIRSAGKFDLATALCKKCLNNNRSCTQAAELLGLIMEKEQSYKDAAEFYEQAWESLGQSSASIGYKLAFNYLKAGRYLDSIDVCHAVLAKHPEYPDIKKHILAKARKHLRP
jgi:tetratricopeptide repeat protein 21B